MKKNLIRVLVAVVLLVALLFVVALVLPSEYHVKRSVVIKAKPEAIYPYLNNFKKWPEWVVWTTAKDPTLVYTYEGPEEGTGAISKWTSKKTGNGVMKMTDAKAKHGVMYELTMDNGKFYSNGAIVFEKAEEGTRVTWHDDGDMGGNLLGRYFVPFFDKMIGSDFEGGLQKLKTRVEQPAN
jgi:polyketide cyclase/dehydrase/lipid transport protein